MAETEIRLDFSLQRPAQIGSISATHVPRYILYGDAHGQADWFLNVEPLEQRCRERGWVIAPHTHPRFLQMVICEDGGGEISVEGERLPFGAASVLIVPPHRIHGFHYRESSRGWVVTIEHNYLASLLGRAPAFKTILDSPGVFALDPAILPAIEMLVEQLGDELNGNHLGGKIGAEIRLLSLLLVLLRNWPAADRQHRAVDDPRTDLVSRYKELVERRYRDQPHLTEVASELGVSISQLRLACKTVAGISPLDIIHDRVLAEAKRCLIYTTMRVAEIAHWLGFSDAAYFSRFFRKVSGQSPTDYRCGQGSGDGHAPHP